MPSLQNPMAKDQYKKNYAKTGKEHYSIITATTFIQYICYEMTMHEQVRSNANP